MCECANRTALHIASCASVGKTILFLPRFVNNRTLQQTTCAMSKDTADANATCTFCLIQPNCTKKCVYKYRKRHYKRIFKKIIVVFTFIFLQNENLNNKKETCCLTFSALEKIFSRGLFLTFCTVICPLHTGIGRGFCCKLFASGNGKHDTSTTFYTVRMTKTSTAKFFYMFCKSDKICMLPF